MDKKLWVLVPYMRPLRNTCKWQAESWKGAPPAKIDGRMSFLEPETALASHLEGVNIAGRLDEYIRGIKEKGWSRSKKTRDRKAGLAKVLTAMEAWDGYAKYASVQQVMEAVKSSQSSWYDTPDSPTKQTKRGGADTTGADTTEGSGGVGGELKDMRDTPDPPTTRAKRRLGMSAVCRFGVGRTMNERAYAEHLRTVKHRHCNLHHTHAIRYTLVPPIIISVWCLYSLMSACRLPSPRELQPSALH